MSIAPTATPSGTSPEFNSIFALFWRYRLPASMSMEPTAMLLLLNLEVRPRVLIALLSIRSVCPTLSLIFPP